jgi:hypothetical protein
MSHDGTWRAACLIRKLIRLIYLEVPSVARGVTGPGVGSGALLAVCFSEATPQESGMTALMNNSENVENIALNLVVDEVRKRPALPARKPVGSDMISALSLDHDPDRLLHTLVKIITKSL